MEGSLFKYCIDAVSTDEFNVNRLEYLALASLVPIKFGAPPAVVKSEVRFDMTPVLVPDWIVARSLKMMLKRVPYTPEMLVASYVQLGLSHLLAKLALISMETPSTVFAGVRFDFTDEDRELVQRSFLAGLERDHRFVESNPIPPLRPENRSEIQQLTERFSHRGLAPITPTELAAWLSYNYEGLLTHFPSLQGRSNIIRLLKAS